MPVGIDGAMRIPGPMEGQTIGYGGPQILGEQIESRQLRQQLRGQSPPLRELIRCFRARGPKPWSGVRREAWLRQNRCTVSTQGTIWQACDYPLGIGDDRLVPISL